MEKTVLCEVRSKRSSLRRETAHPNPFCGMMALLNVLSWQCLRQTATLAPTQRSLTSSRALIFPSHATGSSVLTRGWTLSERTTCMSLWWLLLIKDTPLGQGPRRCAFKWPTWMMRRPCSPSLCKPARTPALLCTDAVHVCNLGGWCVWRKALEAGTECDCCLLCLSYRTFLSEDAGPSTLVATVRAKDPDGDGVLYLIAGGNEEGNFELDSQKGKRAFAARL